MTALRQMVNVTSSATGLTAVCEVNGSPTRATSWRLANRMLLLLFCGVGTGGIARLGSASGSPSSSGGTWREARPVPSVHVTGVASGTSAVSVFDRIAVIRSELSLNMTQVAQALRVGRPALYGWVSDATVPRQAHLSRLKELYDLALQWKSLSGRRVGKYLIMPLDDGKSLAQLLTERRLDSDRISTTFESIARAISTSEDRKRRSGYRSAASIMRERNYDEDAPAVQEYRLTDLL